jgi:hypothetical protein
MVIRVRVNYDMSEESPIDGLLEGGVDSTELEEKGIILVVWYGVHYRLDNVRVTRKVDL